MYRPNFVDASTISVLYFNRIRRPYGANEKRKKKKEKDIEREREERVRGYIHNRCDVVDEWKGCYGEFGSLELRVYGEREREPPRTREGERLHNWRPLSSLSLSLSRPNLSPPSFCPRAKTQAHTHTHVTAETEWARGVQRREGLPPPREYRYTTLAHYKPRRYSLSHEERERDKGEGAAGPWLAT